MSAQRSPGTPALAMATSQPSIAAARRLRVLVLEPFELLREGIQGALSGCEDLAVALDVSADGESLARAHRPPPDVVLLGTDPGRTDGLEAIRRVSQAFSGRPVVVLAQDASLDPFLAAVRAGASGYVLRSVRGAALADAVRTTAYGGSVIDPLVARRLVEQIASQPLFAGWRSRALADPSLLNSLSHREAEVLQLLAQGMSNKEIASTLRLSVGTVKTHLRHVFRKLQVADRTSAALAALRPPSPTPS